MRILTLYAVACLWSSTSFAGRIMPSDLALVLPAGGGPSIPAVEPYFSSPWLQEIDLAFRATSVEDSFLKESHRYDWRLVSLRVAPCQPLLPYVTIKNETLCEAEIRLVWQPIEQRRRDGASSFYADDRAVHALYHADPATFLEPTSARDYTELKSRSASLSDSETRRYGTLHRRLVQGLMVDLLNLRGRHDDGAYTTIAERPEYGTRAGGQAFTKRLMSFLKKQARFEQLKELTAFSLPEGRLPPLLDDWVFVAFNPADHGKHLTPKNITLHSRKDGRVLFDYGPFMNGTMRFDDQRLHEAIKHMPEEDVKEVEEAVILAPRAPAAKKDAIANRRATHVSHTSCASCHKLKSPSFDFHNLSYLEDRPLLPSPRVEQDVAHDLDWLRSH